VTGPRLRLPLPFRLLRSLSVLLMLFLVADSGAAAQDVTRLRRRAERLINFSSGGYPPETNVGTYLSSFDPFPSWPDAPDPQQYAAPVVVSPHV
jgi:hypothetical protein